jgi:uncharacterized heparinase superfamily protein
LGKNLVARSPKIGLTLAKKLQLYLAEIWQWLKRRFVLGMMSPVRVGGAAPDRLLLAPIDLRAPDIFVASEIIAGRFPLSSKMIDTKGQNPFTLTWPDSEFASELHSFRWLRHLRASDDPLAQDVAHNLTQAWMDNFSKRLSGPAWSLDVTSKRLIAWLSHSPIVLANADHEFYQRFMASIAQQIRYLRHVTASHEDPAKRLSARLAIAMASLCLPSTNATVKSAANALDEEIEAQILSDGGHISRNPQATLKILADLLPLRQTYINLGCALPIRMLPAIDRMFLALRFFRHSSGEISLFNGANYVSANYLMSILQNDETSVQTAAKLPQSGYWRLEAGKSVLIMDAGMAPEGRLSKGAHAGCLSFEFSSGANRLVVNAGHPQFQRSRFAEFSRLTAAHSTLIIEETSSARVSHSKFLGPIFVHEPKHIHIGASNDETYDGLHASHDGYLKQFGLIHQRQVRLEKDGKSLSGLDSIEVDSSGKNPNVANTSISIRFHIHPSIVLSSLQDGSILLEASDGDRWIFNATVKGEIESDIFFADVLGPRTSSQIVVSFKSDDDRRIAWILKAV